MLAACGDGLLRADLGVGEIGYESCDDGNINNDDACLINCQIAVCGDGVVRTDLELGDPGYEACDDGNDDDSDDCTSACEIARCGDGIVNAEDLTILLANWG